MKVIEVRTTAPTQFTDITEQVERVVAESGCRSGVCHIFVAHTTAALTINEAEPHLLKDLAEQLERMVPAEAEYRHQDGNAHAHIKASLMGSCQTVLVDRGRIQLGTWQAIFLCEFDGPRQRQVFVQVQPLPLGD